MTDFKDKRFIVTGAASGIGLATARLLRARGAALVLWDQDAALLANAARELDTPSVALDVTQPDSVREALAQSISRIGGLDGVIHAAGILRAGLFGQVALEDHRRTLEVNLFGTVNLAHAALPHLKQSGGSLILLSSVSAYYGAPEYSVYGASKAGVLGFAQALRAELAGSRIQIGVVCPLFVNTPMLNGHNGDTFLIRSRSPFFQTFMPEQIAAAILRGLERRSFMIYPGWRSRLLFAMSRFGSPLMHHLTLMTYRQGGGSVG